VAESKKPSGAEEEYFAREALKRKEQAKIKQSHEEREKLRKLHWMCCPKCGHPLEEVPFRDAAVDRCTACGGIFLDKGELEHLAGQEDNALRSILQVFKKS
jgi:PHP family Zn ribbon phosphoesterase